MTQVYVDLLRPWGGRRVGPFGGGRMSAHLCVAHDADLVAWLAYRK